MNRTVLVVDDSDLVRKVLGFTLKKAGYEVLSAADGQEALTMFDGRDIDAVVTDLNMPNLNGESLIREIRTFTDYRFIPIVLFVSDSTHDTKHFTQTSGATLVFDKDSIKEKLVGTVKKLIG